METLKELNLKNVYRTGKDDLYRDFYKKSLAVSVSYDRAVGYFSSEILAMSLTGLSNLIQSGGCMRLIIGHPLDKDEFNAVKQGFLLKSLVKDFSEKLEKILTENKLPRLELLSYLIASGKLDIKFAFRKAGMYHEKIGILRDKFDNTVVFQGSANETPYGLISTFNSESISVYKSWDEQIFQFYGVEYIEGFERIWKNAEVDIVTVDVPSETYERIYKRNNVINSKLSMVIDFEEEIDAKERRNSQLEPSIPSMIGSNKFEIYKHQRSSLVAWRENGYKGILKLATGSGKTITSIYGAIKIYHAKKSNNQRLFLLISVPYVELALQWIDNLRLFGITAHECFGSKLSWYESLNSKINYFCAGVIDFCCVVVVNKTLVSSSFRTLVNKIDSNSMMIIGDECHNHGSKSINMSLPDAYYRIGLSATPFRSDDDEIDSPFPDEAKGRILEYYSNIVATYGLDDAINDDVLTPYEYHIVPVHLTFDEQEKYEELTSNINKILIKQNVDKLTDDDKKN